MLIGGKKRKKKKAGLRQWSFPGLGSPELGLYFYPQEIDTKYPLDLASSSVVKFEVFIGIIIM